MVKKTPQPPPAAAPKVHYVRTEQDMAAVDAYKARRRARGLFPAMKLTSLPNGVANLSADYPDEQVAAAAHLNALGLSDGAEFTAILKGVVNLTQTGGKADEVAVNEMMALVVGMSPSNPLEAMLASQMAAVHMAAMASAQRLNLSQNSEIIAVHAKAFNNLTRTFAVQAETLKKLRSTGEQRVTVEHKHYHLHQAPTAPDAPEGGGVENETEGQSHERAEQMRLSEREAVLSTIEANRVPVQGAGLDG